MTTLDQIKIIPKKVSAASSSFWSEYERKICQIMQFLGRVYVCRNGSFVSQLKLQCAFLLSVRFRRGFGLVLIRKETHKMTSDDNKLGHSVESIGRVHPLGVARSKLLQVC